jgi:hypothetical protein
MPNWCDNSVTIKHEDKTKIDVIEMELMKWDNGKGDCQLFNTLRPRPADKEENWYDWNIQNWGTKWDASIIDWNRDDDNAITVYYETAWSPPTQLYYHLIEEEFEVYALYHEGGMGFAGVFDNGNDDYFEYDISDLESIEQLPEDLIEFGNLRQHHEDWVENQEEEDEQSN